MRAYLDVALVLFVKGQLVIVEVDATAQKVRRVVQEVSYDGLHHSQADIQLVHLSDSRFPVLDFHWALAIRQKDDLPGPCLLVAKKPVLCFDPDYKSVDSY